MIDKVSRGGNLLLNVGPTADGRIPVIMQERLLQIGKWLSVNGEAIYNSRQWNNMPQENRQQGVYYTINANNTYALLTYTQKQTLYIKGVKNPTEISMLGYNKPISWHKTADGIKIEIPAISVEESPCDYAWVVKIISHEAK